MAEYTFENVIVNPFKEGIESLIGKEVYFEDKPAYCLMKANAKSTDSLGILIDICKNSASPFLVKQNGSVYSHSCIIEKKGDPEPKYEPFKNLEEFLGAHSCVKTDNLDRVHRYLDSHGIWLKEKGPESGAYLMVTEMLKDGVNFGDRRVALVENVAFNDFTSWRELLLAYTFLDGSPCGKKI